MAIRYYLVNNPVTDDVVGFPVEGATSYAYGEIASAEFQAMNWILADSDNNTAVINVFSPATAAAYDIVSNFSNANGVTLNVYGKIFDKTKAIADMTDRVTSVSFAGGFGNNGIATFDYAELLTANVENAAGASLTFTNDALLAAEIGADGYTAANVTNAGTIIINNAAAYATVSGDGEIELSGALVDGSQILGVWDEDEEVYVGENDITISAAITLGGATEVVAKDLDINATVSLDGTAYLQADGDVTIADGMRLDIKGHNQVVFNGDVAGTITIQGDGTLHDSVIDAKVLVGNNAHLLGDNEITSFEFRGTSADPTAAGYRKLTIGDADDDDITTLETELIQIGKGASNTSGALEIVNSNIWITTENDTGALNLAKNSTVDITASSVVVDKIYVASTASITIDVDSTIYLTTGITGGGSIDVDSSNLAEFEEGEYLVYNVIEGYAPHAIAATITLTIDEEAFVENGAVGDTGYYVTTLDKQGLYLINQSRETLYVSSEYEDAGDITNNHLVGYNAFGTLVEALTIAKDLEYEDGVTIEVTDSMDEESIQGLLFWKDGGNYITFKSDVTITAAAEDPVTVTIPFGKGDYGLVLTPADGKTITIDSGVTLATLANQGEEGDDDSNSGTVYLNFSSANTTGEIVVEGNIDSAAEIRFGGSAYVSGYLMAGTSIQIDARAGNTVAIIGSDYSNEEVPNQVTAENIWSNSGTLATIGTDVVADGLALGGGDIFSIGSTWDLSAVGTETNSGAATYSFLDSGIEIYGSAGMTLNNVGTINPGELRLGAGKTLNLIASDLSVSGGTAAGGTGAIINAGTINLGAGMAFDATANDNEGGMVDDGSSITAVSLTNSGTINVKAFAVLPDDLPAQAPVPPTDSEAPQSAYGDASIILTGENAELLNSGTINISGAGDNATASLTTAGFINNRQTGKINIKDGASVTVNGKEPGDNSSKRSIINFRGTITLGSAAVEDNPATDVNEAAAATKGTLTAASAVANNGGTIEAWGGSDLQLGSVLLQNSNNAVIRIHDSNLHAGKVTNPDGSTFSVDGASTLVIGTLDGTITLLDGATISASSITTDGTLFVGTSTTLGDNPVTTADAVTFKGVNTFANTAIDNEGAITIDSIAAIPPVGNEGDDDYVPGTDAIAGKLTAGVITNTVTNNVANSGTITINAGSSISATSITGGTIVLADITGMNGKVVTINNDVEDNKVNSKVEWSYQGEGEEVATTYTIDAYSDDTRVTTADGKYMVAKTDNGKTITVIDASAGQSTLYVSSDFAAKPEFFDFEIGGQTITLIKGYNAFSSFVEALTIAQPRTADTTITVLTDITENSDTTYLFGATQFLGNVTINGTAIVDGNNSRNPLVTLGGNLVEFDPTPADNKTFAFSAGSTEAGTVGVDFKMTAGEFWPNEHPTDSAKANFTIASEITAPTIVFKNGTTSVTASGSLKSASNILFYRKDLDLTITGKGGVLSETYAADEYQVSAAKNLIFRKGSVTTTGSKITAQELSVTDDNGEGGGDSSIYKTTGSILLNSTNTDWTITGDAYVRFYETLTASLTFPVTFNFKQGSRLGIGGNFINEAHATNANGQSDLGEFSQYMLDNHQLEITAPAIDISLDASALEIGSWADANHTAVVAGTGAFTNAGTVTAVNNSFITALGAITNKGTITIGSAAVAGVEAVEQVGQPGDDNYVAPVAAVDPIDATAGTLTAGSITNSGTINTFGGDTAATRSTVTVTGYFKNYGTSANRAKLNIANTNLSVGGAVDYSLDAYLADISIVDSEVNANFLLQNGAIVELDNVIVRKNEDNDKIVAISNAQNYTYFRAKNSEIHVETITNSSIAENLGHIRLTDSTLDATTVTTSKEFTVDGASKLSIGKLTGAITLVNGAAISDSYIDDGGELDINDGSTVSFTGTNIFAIATAGSTAAPAGIAGTTISNAGTVNVTDTFTADTIGNAGTVSVAGSTLTAVSVANADGDGAEFNVSGASKLTIGDSNGKGLEGTITLANGAALSDSAIYGAIGVMDNVEANLGAIEVGAGSTVSFATTTTDAKITNKGTINVTSLTAADITNTNATITVSGTLSAASIAGGTIDITAAGSTATAPVTVTGAAGITGSNICFTVDGLDGTAAEYKFVAGKIDAASKFYLGTVAAANEVKNLDTITVGEGDAAVAYTLTTKNGNGLSLVKKPSTATLYVNATWDASTVFTDGKVFGINAFNTLTDALAYAETDSAVTAIQVTSSKALADQENLLFTADAAKAYTGITVSYVGTTANDTVGSIAFKNGDFGLFLRPNMTIGKGVDIVTTAPEGANAWAGTVYFDYAANSGSITVNSNITAAGHIYFLGESTVTGNLTAGGTAAGEADDRILLFRAGKSNVENATANKKVTIVNATGSTVKPVLTAAWFELESGDVDITNALVNVEGFSYKNTDASLRTANEFVLAPTLNSSNTTWNIGYFETNSAAANVDGVLNFTGSTVNVNQAVGLGTNAAAEIGGKVTVNLTGSEFNVAAGTLNNAGIINVLDATSVLSAKAIKNSGTIQSLADITTPGNIDNTGSFTAVNVSGATIKNNGANASFTTNNLTAARVEGDGTFTVNGVTNVTGNIRLGGNATFEGNIANVAILNALAGSVVTINSQTVSTNGGIRTEGGAITINGSKLDNNELNFRGGTITVTGAASLKNVTITKYGDNVQDVLDLSGVTLSGASVTGGTVNVTGASNTFNGVNEFGSFTVAADASLTIDATAMTAYTGPCLTINGNFTNNGSITIDAGNRDFGNVVDALLVAKITGDEIYSMPIIVKQDADPTLKKLMAVVTTVPDADGNKGIYLVRDTNPDADTVTIAVNSAWATKSLGETFEFAGATYVFGRNAFKGLDDLQIAYDTTTVEIVAGTYAGTLGLTNTVKTLKLVDGAVTVGTLVVNGITDVKGVTFSTDQEGNRVETAVAGNLTATDSTINGKLDVTGSTVDLGAVEGASTGTIYTDVNSVLAYADEAFAGTTDINVDGLKAVTATNPAKTFEITGSSLDEFTVSGAYVANDTPASKYFTYDDGLTQIAAACNVYDITDRDSLNTATAYTWNDGAYRPDELVVTSGSFTKAAYFYGTDLYQKYAAAADKSTVVFTSADTKVRHYQVTIEDGAFTNLVFGGQMVPHVSATSDYMPVTIGKEINLTINGGTFGTETKHMTVCGGDNVKDIGFYQRVGAINLTINGGTFNSVIATGMYYNNGTDGEDQIPAMVWLNGDANLTISGGTFNDYIFGGNLAYSKTMSGSTQIIGNANVTIQAGGEEDIVLNQSLYVGSYGNGKISGKTRLTLTGSTAIDEENNDFQKISAKEVFGGCSGDYFMGDERKFISAGMGDDNQRRYLTFDNFDGKFECDWIRGFSNVEVLNGTDATLNDSALGLADVSNWTFDAGSTISGAFANDFTGDKLVLSGLDTYEFGQDGWMLFSDTTNFTFSDKLNINGTNYDCDGATAITFDGNYKLSFDDSKMIVTLALA